MGVDQSRQELKAESLNNRQRQQIYVWCSHNISSFCCPSLVRRIHFCLERTLVLDHQDRHDLRISIWNSNAKKTHESVYLLGEVWRVGCWDEKGAAKNWEQINLTSSDVIALSENPHVSNSSRFFTVHSVTTCEIVSFHESQSETRWWQAQEEVNT